MMQRYHRGASVRSDATEGSSDLGEANDDVFGGSRGGTGSDHAQRLHSIFPAHIVPSAAERRATADQAMADSMVSRFANGPRPQRRSIRDLLVRDSDSDSDVDDAAPHIVNPTSPPAAQTPQRPLGDVAPPAPAAAVPRGSAASPQEATAPAAPQRPHGIDAAVQRPHTIEEHATSSNSGKLSEGVRSPLPLVQLPVLRSPPSRVERSPSSPTPKAHADTLPARKLASPDAYLDPIDEPMLQPSRGRSPGSGMLPPPPVAPPRRAVSAEHHQNPSPPLSRGPGSLRATPVADRNRPDSASAAPFPERNGRVDSEDAIDERSFQEPMPSASPRQQQGPRRPDGIFRPTPTSPLLHRPLRAQQPSQRQEEDEPVLTPLRRQTPSPNARKAGPIMSPDSYHREASPPTRTSPEQQKRGASPKSVQPQSHAQRLPPYQNPLHASLHASAKYKAAMTAPAHKGPQPVLPPKASAAKTSTATQAVGGSPKAVHVPRANSASMLSEFGVFATAPSQTFGPCSCGQHDAVDAFCNDSWVQSFLEYSRGWRSAERFFDLEAQALLSPVASEAEGGRSKRRQRVCGVWCSVDTIQKRRADILPPKRYLIIAGGSGGGAPSFQGLEHPPVELLLFPQEPLDAETGVVQCVPCASFPVTPRCVSRADGGKGLAPATDPVAQQQAGALTFTRVRLAPRKYHLILEVVCIPLGPLLEEDSARAAMNNSGRHRALFDSMERNGASSTTLLDGVLRSIERDDDDVELPQNAFSVVGGATLGLFDPATFLEVLGALLDITNNSRAWLAAQLHAAFDTRRMSKASTGTGAATQLFDADLSKAALRGAAPRIDALSALDRIDAVFRAVRSPLASLEFRVPTSLWSSSVDRVFQLLEEDQNLRSGASLISLESLQFRDVPGQQHGILTYDAFGAIKSAVHMPSNTLFDVRCLPQNKTALYGPCARGMGNAHEAAASSDGDTALVLEYVSRFPFVQRIHSVLSDGGRYYIVLPPFLSRAVAANGGNGDERGRSGRGGAGAVEQMALYDLCRRVSPHLKPSHHMDYVRLVSAQLILAVGLLHSRGVVVGALTPRRFLCKVTHGVPRSRSTSVETSLTGVGVSSVAFSWLRQQKGVLEYLSPAFLAQFLDVKAADPSVERAMQPPNAQRPADHGIDEDRAAATVGVADDWWALGCILFEVFSRGLQLFPLPTDGGKAAHIAQWAELLVNIDGPTGDANLAATANTNVSHHVSSCVQRVSETFAKQWDASPTSTSVRTPSPNKAAASSSNLLARRVEERRSAQANASHGVASERSQERQQWHKSLTEFTQVLHALLDVNNFACTLPEAKHNCPSNFHGVVVQLMMLPFFKGTDWVDAFNQAPSSIVLSGVDLLPSQQRTSSGERSHSAGSEGRGGLLSRTASHVPRTGASQASPQRVASSPRLSKKPSRAANSFMEGSEHSEAVDAPRPHPLAMYSAEETAALVDVLRHKGTSRDKELAEMVKREDFRLHQWSADAIPPVVGATSFLKSTASFQMYRRTVKERQKQLHSQAAPPPSQGEGSDSDPSPIRRSPPARHGSASHGLSAPQRAAANLISPLHGSYTFQRPKGFIDLVMDRKVGTVYDAPPSAHQGDVKVYTKPLLSRDSKHAVSNRHFGYMDPVTDKGTGTYAKPEPLPKTFGEPPPLVDRGSQRLALGSTRTAVGMEAHDYEQALPPQTARTSASVSMAAPPPATNPLSDHGDATRSATATSCISHTSSVSPDTPRRRVEDPAVNLFASPAAAPMPSPAKGKTPASRHAMRLPPKSDVSSDRSSAAAPRSTEVSESESARAVGSQRRQSGSTSLLPSSGRRAVQRPPRHAIGGSEASSEAVALPPSVTSVRSTTTTSTSSDKSEGVVLRRRSPGAAAKAPATRAVAPTAVAAPEPPVHTKQRRVTPVLGRWERSDSEDEGKDTRRVPLYKRGPTSPSPTKSPKTSRGGVGVGGVVTADKKVPLVVPPPPPQHSLADDDDDDALFS